MECCTTVLTAHNQIRTPFYHFSVIFSVLAPLAGYEPPILVYKSSILPSFLFLSSRQGWDMNPRSLNCELCVLPLYHWSRNNTLLHPLRKGSLHKSYFEVGLTPEACTINILRLSNDYSRVPLQIVTSLTGDYMHNL